jgi:hypothetical protein
MTIKAGTDLARAGIGTALSAVNAALTAIVAPPRDMATPLAEQRTALLAIGALVALMLLAALWRWRRTGNPTGVLLLVGGLACSLNEPLVDLLGHCFFPGDGWISHTFFGYPVPVWVVLAYVGFFGGLTWLTVELLRSGTSRRTVRLGVGAVWVLNLILEMPLLASGLYVYYGEQPFSVGGFPVSWLVINSLGSMSAAVVVVRLSGWFVGARRALLVLVPYVTYLWSWVLAMPNFVALNAEVPTEVRWLATAVSFLLGLAAIEALVRVGVASPDTPAVPAPETVGASPA